MQHRKLKVFRLSNELLQEYLGVDKPIVNIFVSPDLNFIDIYLWDKDGEELLEGMEAPRIYATERGIDK